MKVVMPKLGLTMKEGIVANWLKAEGEAVQKGEPLLEVETEKIVMPVEAPASGILSKILARESSVVEVGAAIAIITVEGEELLIEEPPLPGPVEQKAKISPVARKLAKDHNIDFRQIVGTGPDGRIVKEDVLRVLDQAPGLTGASDVGSPKVAATVPLTNIRRTISERLSKSYHDAIHVTITVEVDMTSVDSLLVGISNENQGSAVSPSYTDVLVKAVATAIEKNRIVNSTLEQDHIKIFEDINVGVATGTNEGLVVPVVRNADRKSLIEISNELKNLVEKARSQRLSLEDVSMGTFTVSNLGMFGVETFDPIINPPQSAILGVGAVVKKAVVLKEELRVRPVMTLSLVFDHRVFDGVAAALFLKTLKTVLESPELYLKS